jgi:hypothetical protein
MSRAISLASALLFPLLLAPACGDKEQDDTAPPEGDTDTDTDADGDTDSDTDADTDSDTDTDPPGDDWTILVWMNGDNDLESYVFHDLNELEEAGSSDTVNIVVQADRAEGYSSNDGDWTDTRRYYIAQDHTETVVSEIIEEIGEADMGDPGQLSEFLMWAWERWPAEHVMVVMWDHGDGWLFQDTPTLPGISYDDESRNGLSIAEGELREGLQALVDARGPIDILAFDACSMAGWEVGHALKDHATYMVASEATLGMEGLQYNTSLALLHSQPDITPRDLAQDLARAPVEEAGEWTMSATDLTTILPLSNALDALAGSVLANEGLMDGLIAAREAADGTHTAYPEFYMDIGSFADALEARSEPTLANAGASINQALDTTAYAPYGAGRYTWSSGLNILLDENWPSHLRSYQNGAGATWSQDTQWDELLYALADR